jgi:hypothetical protein
MASSKERGEDLGPHLKVHQELTTALVQLERKQREKGQSQV